MIKLFIKVAALSLCLLVCALTCSSGHALAADSQKVFRILASTFPIYKFVANICVDAKDISLELLVPAAAGCPHDFAPSPADISKLARASVLVVNGAGLEDFLKNPLKNAAPELPAIDASRGLSLLDDAAHGHPNPHVFASPADAAKMVRIIAAGLARENPENAPIYEKNAERYAAVLERLAAEFAKIGEKAPNRSIALEHDALAYLAKCANLEIAVIFEHSSSAAALARLEKELKAKKPALLAGDAQYSDRLLATISTETGIPYAMLNPCANGPADSPMDYYETVMKENLKILEARFE